MIVLSQLISYYVIYIILCVVIKSRRAWPAERPRYKSAAGSNELEELLMISKNIGTFLE